MNPYTCLKKLSYVGVLEFATVDRYGHPEVRCISAIHFEEDSFFFLTGRGKDFAKELDRDGHVQILAYTRFKEMIRVSAIAVKLPKEKQEQCRNIIFKEQPYMENVYPQGSRDILDAYEIRDMQIEYFNLGTHPIDRYYYALGKAKPIEKGYRITSSCIGCGTCYRMCPQKTIEKGKPYHINQDHCLQCGRCFEHCPVKAIINVNE